MGNARHMQIAYPKEAAAARAHADELRRKYEQETGNTLAWTNEGGAVVMPMPTAHDGALAGPEGNDPNLADQLERLTTLHGTGALSDDEYAAAKAKLLER